MIRERILVRGPRVRAAIIAAGLTARWAGQGREVVIAPDSEETGGRSIIARPDHLRFHGEIGLQFNKLAQECGATTVFALAVKGASRAIALPFAPFGAAKSGVEFHQFWARASAEMAVPDLTEFSLAIALENTPRKIEYAALPSLQLPFGLKLDEARYAKLLQQIALAQGANTQTERSLKAGDYDFVFDCGASQSTSGWYGDRVDLAVGTDIPGLEWQICVNAVRRFVSLAGNLKANDQERQEYNRLSLAEESRISDMTALLQQGDPRTATSETLRRKVAVFEACGRIPAEDFEVFTPPEWLAALWGRGIRPRRYDRMAEVMPFADLKAWLAKIHQQVRQVDQGGERR